MQIHRKSLFITRFAADIFILLCSYVFALYISLGAEKFDLNIKTHFLGLALSLVWFFSAKTTRLYDEFRSRNYIIELISVYKNIAIQIIAAIVILFSMVEYRLPRMFVLSYAIIMVVFHSVNRYLFRTFLKYLRKKGRNLRNLLIVGAGKVGYNFYQTILNNPQFGYKVVGFLDDKNKSFLNGQYLGKIDDLDQVLDEKEIDNVIIALPNFALSRIEEVIRICEQHTTRIKIIPNYFNVVSSKYSVTMFGSFPVISVREDRVNEFNWRLLKRAFDFLFSLSVIILVFSWLFPLLALIIKTSSKGPVFFKQKRWGKNNKNFTTLKFRSMVVESKDIGDDGKFQQAKKDDPRITKIGAFLRKTNLDELPQFINVLMGDMSIVGPRPHPGPLNLQSKDKVKMYMLRHLVKPGITGWAQVNGHRGETGSVEKMQKRIEHDIWYIENWSFWLDIQIIFMTVWNMIKGDPNAY
ncbi:MAG: undecaprenyl-phosphate glucose phosphotransferase [Ignavibacteria bacterium]|nr:undecaprenyl-phosphate glucose phosphotransferase [Ignavibacteria bacterium]